jgi:hypothetical protein
MSNYTRGTNFTAKDSLVTGNPSKLVKGSEIDAELNAISTAIATKLDTTTAASTYAPLASPALTGTPTAPTPATSDDSTKIATTEYVQNVAMNTALPGQTGNAGKFVKTDGTNASWAYAGIATVNSSITTNATVSGSYVYQPVAMATMGKSVTLPDATTLSTGGPQYIFKNEGGYPFGVRDSAGTLIMAVAAGGIAYVTLKDNSTAAGSWSVIGDNLEPGLITIDNTFSSTYASTVLAPFVALDSNTSIHFATLSSGFAAFVVDNTGKAVGTPVTVSSTASDLPKAAFKVSSTSAIVFYANGSSYKAVALTVTGTSISVGSAATSPDNNAWAQEDSVGAPQIAQLASGLYVVSYYQGGAIKTVAVVVSGATVTIGTAVNIIGSGGVAASTTTYALTATTALVLYLSGASANYTPNAVVVSVSGTTCTVGTPVGGGAVHSTTGAMSSCLLSSTKAVWLDNNGGGGVRATAITISGTSVSLGSALSIEAFASATVDYSSNSATRYNPHLFPLSSSTALLWYLDSSGISRAVVLSESGGTVTAGTIMYGSISSAASSAAGYGNPFPQGTTEFVAFRQDGASSSWKYRAVPHKISGTSITTGAVAHLEGPVGTPMVIEQGTVRLTSGDYLVIGSASYSILSLPVFRSNGDAIAYRGNIKVPVLLSANKAQAALASNRLVLLGSTANQGTTIGTSTYQLRLLNIEVAA